MNNKNDRALVMQGKAILTLKISISSTRSSSLELEVTVRRYMSRLMAVFSAYDQEVN